MSTPITKCTKCTTHYQGFHICIDLSTPEPKIDLNKKRWTPWGKMTARQLEEYRQAREDARKQASIENFARDEEIIEWYSQGGVSYTDIRLKYRIGQSTIQRILKRGEEEGRISIRRKHYTLSTGAK